MISVLGTTSSILLRARIPLQLHSPKNLWSSSSSIARCSSSSSHHLQPLDVAQLAQTACITLSPQEVEDFVPRIRQVVDWFGQLQAVDLESIEPSLRADTEVSSSPREDIPETFGNRDAMLAEIPSFAEPYIKVPKVLNKE